MSFVNLADQRGGGGFTARAGHGRDRLRTKPKNKLTSEKLGRCFVAPKPRSDLRAGRLDFA